MEDQQQKLKDAMKESNNLYATAIMLHKQSIEASEKVEDLVTVLEYSMHSITVTLQIAIMIALYYLNANSYVLTFGAVLIGWQIFKRIRAEYRTMLSYTEKEEKEDIDDDPSS